MKKNIIFLFIILSFFSCKKIDKAKNIADEFYRLRSEKKIDSAALLCSSYYWQYTDFESFKKNILTSLKENGKIISYKPVFSKFYTKIDTFSDVVVFKYRIIYEKKIAYDSLALINTGDSYKILFHFN